MEPISVVIPVGPDPAYLKFLPECIESVLNQTYKPTEIILIDDGMDLFSRVLMSDLFKYDKMRQGREDSIKFIRDDITDVIYYKTLWNVGVPDAFNFGIALSEDNLVFTIGSDDKMLPTCLEKCAEAYDKHKKEGWYYVKYQLESGDILQIQNNTAMVTRSLWHETGGFPPSAGVGACDALLLSIMMKHMPDRIIPVESDEPLCWLREGDHQDTRKNGWLFGEEIVSIRGKETDRWKPKN